MAQSSYEVRCPAYYEHNVSRMWMVVGSRAPVSARNGGVQTEHRDIIVHMIITDR